MYPDILEKIQLIQEGNRNALALCITLIESDRIEDQEKARFLLQAIHKIPTAKHLILGITGPPGAGKSSLIEVVALDLLPAFPKIAILTVDPSSRHSKGSILGDKTRMSQISNHPQIYIRPSPSKSELGGITKHTKEVIKLCITAKYDLILIETVGVGQSEQDIASLSDMNILIVPPAAGDSLQGIKRGIMEIADLIVISKHDGDLSAKASEMKREMELSLQFIPAIHDWWKRKVILTSALEHTGIEDVTQSIKEFFQTGSQNGAILNSRQISEVNWFENQSWSTLQQALFADIHIKNKINMLKSDILQNKISSSEALEQWLTYIFARFKNQ